MKKQTHRRDESPDVEFDAERAARRKAGAQAEISRLTETMQPGPKRDAKVRRLERRVIADIATPMDQAVKHGAALGDVQTLIKASWRLAVVDVPEGEQFVEALPAVVVQFDGNSPLQRLQKAGVLADHQVRAAAKFIGLWVASVKMPKVTASYDGVVAAGGAAPRPWIDVKSDAYQKLKGAMGTMLQVECEVVMEVAVFETPIDALAKKGLVAHRKQLKAEGAIVQSLSCGLERLSMHWGLAAGVPRDVPK